MAKLKLWVRNLIISLVLIFAVAGVGVGLYFVFQPKQPGTEPDKPRELTPEQREFISAVSQNEQIDVNPQAYAGLVISDGEGEPTAISVNNIVGKFGDYFVTNIAGDIAIYKQDEGSASLTSTTTNQAITLNKVVINTEFDKIYQGDDGRDEFYISGDYAILEKVDHSLVIVSLLTGNVVLEQDAFDATDVEEIEYEQSYTGTYWRVLQYFGNNFLIVHDFVQEIITVYHLGDIEHPIVYSGDNQFLGCEITKDYAEFVSSQKTSVYYTKLDDDGRLALVFDEITNSAATTTGTDAVATINGVSYSSLEYSTVQFIPDTPFAIIARNRATTEEKVLPDANGNAQEKYDGVFYDNIFFTRILVGVNYRVLNLSDNQEIDGVKLSGKVKTQKSSIAGYIEIIEEDHLQYEESGYQISVASEQYARYFDADFNEMVKYSYSVSGDIVYFTGDTYYAVGGSSGSESLNVWGERIMELNAWKIVSNSIVNSIAVVKHVADASSFELYNVSTKQNVVGRYKFVSQIMNGKVIAYKAAETEEDVSGFYVIDLATMTRSAIVGFDESSFNLISGSVGFYFTKGADEKYTMHFTSGAEDITNITSYDFYGAENSNGIKVPQVIDGKVYVEISVEGQSAKQIISGGALGEFAELSNAEITEKYPITITEINSVTLTRTRLLDKSIATVSSYDKDTPEHGNDDTITLAKGKFKVEINMSGDIPVYTMEYNSSGFSTLGEDEEYEYTGVSISDSELTTPVAKMSSGTIYLKDDYILHKGSTYASSCDYPALELAKDGDWYKRDLGVASRKKVTISAYKASVTRYYSKVDWTWNSTGTHYVSHDGRSDKVVQYNIHVGGGKTDVDGTQYEYRFLTKDGYTMTSHSGPSSRELVQQRDYGGKGNGSREKSWGSWFGDPGYSYADHIWAYYGIGIDVGLWFFGVSSVSGVTVTYSMPGYSDNGKIYIAPTKSNADPGNNTTTDCVESGESLGSVSTVYGSVSYGFVKNHEYRGDDYVGTKRTDFSGFVKSSYGFTFAGLYQDNDKKIDHDGTIANTSISGELKPRQYAKVYKVYIHYADGDYNADVKLPTSNSDYLKGDGSINTDVYGKDTSTGSFHAEWTYKYFTYTYNQTIDNLENWWQNNASATPGASADVCAPRGYRFDHLYMPGTSDPKGGNIELNLNSSNMPVSTKFGHYSGGNFADYITLGDGKTQDDMQRIQHAENQQEAIINLYAVYTQRTYTWQVDLSSQFKYLTNEYSDRTPAGIPNNLKLYINGTTTSQNWNVPYTLASNLTFCGGEGTHQILPIMYVSDGERYFEVIVEHNPVGATGDYNQDKNLSFGDSRQIDNLYTTLNAFSDFVAPRVFDDESGESTRAYSRDKTQDGDGRIIVINAILKPMEYALTYTQEIDDHMYRTSDSVVETELGGVNLNKDASNLNAADDHYTGTWVSGGNKGNDKVIYNNFFVGYQAEIYYHYYGQEDNHAADKGYYVHAIYQRRGVDDSSRTILEHGTYTISGGNYNYSTGSSTTIAIVVAFATDSNTLTITFYNNYGYFHLNSANTIGEFGLGDDVQKSQISVRTKISTLPYELDVETTSSTSSSETNVVHYTENGQPNAEGIVNNSISEAAQSTSRYGKYDSTGTNHYEQLGYGSTVLVNIGSSLYRFLHGYGALVPDSAINSIKLLYGSTILLDKSGLGADMQEFAKAMSAATAPSGTGDYAIKRVDLSNYHMIANNGGDVVIANEAQLNALLAIMYGRNGADANLNTSMTNIRNVELNPLLYSIQKIEYSGFVAYIITTKFIDNTNANDKAQFARDNIHYGVATAIIFDINQTWSAGGTDGANHKYKLQLVTSPIEFDVTLSVEINADASGSDGMNVVWNKSESWVGDSEIDDRIEQTDFDASRTHIAGGIDYIDKAVASDYLVFDINAKKGYYLDKVYITYNGERYRVQFDSPEIRTALGVDQQQMNANYRIYYGDSTNPVAIVNSSDNIVKTNVDCYLAGDNTYLRIINNAIVCDETNQTIMKIVVGYNRDEFKIVAHYGTYTLLRFEAQDEPRKVEYENNYIGYSYSDGDLKLLKSFGSSLADNKTIATIHFGTLSLNNDEAKQKVYALGQNHRSGHFTLFRDETTFDGTKVGIRETEILYFFVKDYSVKGTSSRITIDSELSNTASYQLEQVNGNIGTFRHHTASMLGTGDDGYNIDIRKTHQVVKSTYTGAINNIDVVSFVIKPKHITTTINSNIDFSGGETSKSYYVLEETLETVTGIGEYNLNGKPDADFDGLYFVNNIYDTSTANNRGQIASTHTEVEYRNKNQTVASAIVRPYVMYNAYYDVFGNNLTLYVHTEYGYEFTGFTLVVTFDEGGSSPVEYVAHYTLQDLILAPDDSICSVSRDGSSNKVIGSYVFEPYDDASGFEYYKFALTITNLDSSEFYAKLHYAAKTFNVNYATNQAFGSTAVNEEQQIRTFVYNVVSDVNYGTKYIGSNQEAASTFNGTRTSSTYYVAGETPTSANGGINYTRIGYDQVGWAFGTLAFGKIHDETSEALRGGRYNGQTENIDTYLNGVTEDNYSTYADFAAIRALIEIYPAIYLTALYKVGRYNSADGTSTNAGFAWYYSLGKNYAKPFGEDNKIASSDAETTLYAIWNAKDYRIVIDYNDSTTTNTGSSTASKFYAQWVFDQDINVLDEEFNKLSFDTSAWSDDNNIINKLYNSYRLGYTFDGWYFKEGTFNSASGWDAHYLFYQNDYTDKLADFKTSEEPTSCLDDNMYQYIKNLANGTDKVWEEMQDEYDESQESYISRHTLDGARMDSNRSRIDIFAKWTANVYTFVYDLNAVDYNVNNFNALSWNGVNLENKIAMGVGSTHASLGESDGGIVQIAFDTEFNLFKEYAYRYGYQFVGWYATRNYNGDLDRGLIEEETLDADMLMYFMNYTDVGYSTDTPYDYGGTELILLQAKAHKLLVEIINADDSSVDYRTNVVDSVDVVDGKASNGADASGTALLASNNKILLHARWHALSYTMNIDLNNEGHIDYTWIDADYAVAGAETYASGVEHHLVDNDWLKFKLIFDQSFDKGQLTIGSTYLLNYSTTSESTSHYIYRDEGRNVTGEIKARTLTFSHYNVEKTISGSDWEILCKILYSYGYNLGLTNGSNTYYFTLIRDTLGFEIKGVGDPAKNYAINGAQVFNEEYLLYAKYEATEVSYETTLAELVDIDYSGQDKGDRHLIAPDENDSAENNGERKLTIFAYWTQKTLDADNNDITHSSVEQYNNGMHNTGHQVLTTEGEYVVGETEHVTKYDKTSTDKTNTTITFYVPSGQYVSELYIDIYDDRLNFSLPKAGRVAYVGRLTLYFGWDSVTRTTTIGKQLADGRIIIGSISIVHDLTGMPYNRGIYGVPIDGTGDVAYYLIDNDENNYRYLANALKIETSVYKTNEASLAYWSNLEKSNINNGYKLQSEPFEEGSNYDINIITLTLESLKTNFVVSAKSFAQTYQVDYYRYIRPLDELTTKIDDDPTSSTYGQEYWDSDFYNDWDQYLVYQTLTYRYGEYASMSYSYANNFAFENWYYYQAHVNNLEAIDYNKYSNYDLDGANIYPTQTSSNIPPISAGGTPGDYLIDEFGYWTAITYTWNNSEHKYMNGDEDYGITEKIADLDAITIHTYHRYQHSDGRQFVGSASEYGFYNNATYKYDRKPVRGNTSLIALYIPASVHRVHYYSWDVAGGYVDRTASTRKYIMGEKKDVQVTTLSGSTVVETWILGNNSEYYYVGFSGINSFSSGSNLPTQSSAYAFLAQFLNCTVAPATYTVINANKIAISWENLKTALDSGITLNGKTYSTEEIKDNNCQIYAQRLLKVLVQEYSNKADSRIYGFNGTYLSDIDVIRNMTFYSGDFKETIEAIVLPGIRWYEEGGYYYIDNDHVDESYLPTAATTPYNPDRYPGQTYELSKQNAYNAAYAKIMADYQKTVFNVVYQQVVAGANVADLFLVTDEDGNKTFVFPAGLSEVEINEANTFEIVENLAGKDLNILLNSISEDYFGFVLKNPSDVVNIYPSGDSTYFAGWYLADNALLEYLAEHPNIVLTFNSDTWNLDPMSYVTLYIGKVEYHEEDGTTTYELWENNDAEEPGKIFVVSRFHTIDQLTHVIDKLSRVENEINVFAAFNCYRFEFKATADDVVMGSNELQWGSRVADLNGDPYQYRLQDVTYYALTQAQYDEFLAAVAQNDNLPTSLQYIVHEEGISGFTVTAETDGVKVTGYLDFSAKDAITRGGLDDQTYYIIACVHNIKEIVADVRDPEGKSAIPEYDSDSIKIINMVSSKMVVVKGGVASIATTGEVVEDDD